MKTKVLVLGASGFIGRNLVEELIKFKGWEIYGSYFKTKPDKSLKSLKSLKLQRVDLTDPAQVNKIIRGKDIVIQAAAVTSGSKEIVSKPYIHVTDNAVMNSLIFRACFDHRVNHLVFFSCTVMYPSQRRTVKETDFKYQITDKYFGVGWTKVYLEKMAEFYSKLGVTKYTVIRHSNIYGPFDKYDLERSHVFGATVTKVMTAKDGKLTVWGDGSESRDLLYVSDLVNFVVTAIKSQTEKFELINVGLGKAISIKQLVKKLVKLSGKEIKIEYDKSKPTIKFNLVPDISRARKIYKWRPRTSLDEGIKKTLAWYKTNYQ